MSMSTTPSTTTANSPADKVSVTAEAPTKAVAPAVVKPADKPAKEASPPKLPAVKKPAVKKSAGTPWVDTLPKAALKPPGKPPAKPPAKPAGKPAGKPATKAVTAKTAATKKTAKPTKPTATVKPKAKLVRDSFTMPQVDFDLITALKDRALGFKRPTKKSELLRAGLQVLAGLSPEALKQTLGRLAPLKAGRPKKAD